MSFYMPLGKFWYSMDEFNLVWYVYLPLSITNKYRHVGCTSDMSYFTSTVIFTYFCMHASD